MRKAFPTAEEAAALRRVNSATIGRRIEDGRVMAIGLDPHLAYVAAALDPLVKRWHP